MSAGETPEEDAQTRAVRSRNLGLLLGLLVLIIILAVAGSGFVIKNGNAAAPRLPAAPPHAHVLGASQTTSELGSNQVTSTALYRVSDTPAKVIAYYKHAFPRHAGSVVPFTIVVRNGTVGALPTALQSLPDQFIDGAGLSARATYTFGEYNYGASDLGIAVDLRHPNGPTLVYVDMLSS